MYGLVLYNSIRILDALMWTKIDDLVHELCVAYTLWLGKKQSLFAITYNLQRYIEVKKNIALIIIVGNPIIKTLQERHPYVGLAPGVVLYSSTFQYTNPWLIIQYHLSKLPTDIVLYYPAVAKVQNRSAGQQPTTKPTQVR